MTSTINTNFGSMVMVPEWGIILNDEMDDFSSPNASNYFGLAPSTPNFIAPGKRPLSSMSPTIVLRDEEVYLIAGASGGPKIITSTTQVLLYALHYGMNVQQAVYHPRLHHQHLPDVVRVEPSFSESTMSFLASIGDKIKQEDSYSLGDVQVILVEGDKISASSDFRKCGKPDGY
mmetsp:Transcript_26991/g.44062  ORF Transcript_26991/g.44062 Transcript_26991/m.44062 type:complete len:175 (+) Transcript_26991:803-1327(+)